MRQCDKLLAVPDQHVALEIAGDGELGIVRYRYFGEQRRGWGAGRFGLAVDGPDADGGVAGDAHETAVRRELDAEHATVAFRYGRDGEPVGDVPDDNLAVFAR